MDTSAPREARRAAPALVALVVVAVLLGLVAVAAGGDTPLGERVSRRPSHLLIDTFVSLYLVMMAVGAVLFVWLYAQRRHSVYERERLGRHGPVRTLVGIALVLVALTLIVRLASDRRREQTQRPGGADTSEAQRKLEREDRYEPQFATIPVLVVLGLGGVAAAALVVASRRRKHALGASLSVDLSLALEDALAETLDDLRAERDPRKAVIAAYARLEHTLAAYGLARRPAEAPDEYLRRVLSQLEVSHAAIARLTALFERAKFSQHEVDMTMKDEAIGALETTRDELREARERELAERAAALEEARRRAAPA